MPCGSALRRRSCCPPRQVKKGPFSTRSFSTQRHRRTSVSRTSRRAGATCGTTAPSGAAFKALPDDVKSKLDVYGVTGVQTLSILMNPYPNAAPYTVATRDGKTLFNPFAIREVRFAMNFLINRKQIIDEIMVGAGLPMYTRRDPGAAEQLALRPHREQARLHRDGQREEGPRGHRRRPEGRRRPAGEQGQAGQERPVVDVQRRAGERQVPHPRRRPDPPPPRGPLHRGPDREGRHQGRTARVRPRQGALAVGTKRPQGLRVEPLHRGLGRRPDLRLLGDLHLPDVRPLVCQHARRGKRRVLELRERRARQAHRGRLQRPREGHRRLLRQAFQGHGDRPEGGGARLHRGADHLPGREQGPFQHPDGLRPR